MNKIAIEINGERYEAEFDREWIMINDFDELFRKADLIEEDESLRSLTPDEEYILDR